MLLEALQMKQDKDFLRLEALIYLFPKSVLLGHLFFVYRRSQITFGFSKISWVLSSRNLLSPALKINKLKNKSGQ